MRDVLRFIHITDTHIGPDPDYLLYDFNTFDCLKHLVHYINTDLPFEPDFILHTGDVMYNPDPPACELAHSVLKELKYPTYYVRGNHDDPDTMRQFLPNLPSGKGRIDYDFVHNDFHFIILDTFGLEQPKGYLESYQLEWLQQKCQHSSARSLVIVLHHLPVITGNGWLDGQMYIENHDALFDVLSPFKEHIRGLFFGHVHCPTTTLRNGIICSSAPSVFGQFIYPPKVNNRLTMTSPGGFSLVTLSHDQTWISHHLLPAMSYELGE